MCKEIFFWFTEYLNYFALIFFGIKLFLKKYDVQRGRKEWVENMIVIASSIPVVWFCADNYRFVVYSNAMTIVIILYINLFLDIYTKKYIIKKFLIVGIVVNLLRLIDLFLVTISCVISLESRTVRLDFVERGIERSVFLLFLCMIYKYVYEILKKNSMLNLLNRNIYYRWILFIYSFVGLLCFCKIYRFGYSNVLVPYWILYLIGLFSIITIFWFYYIEIKEKEEKRILSIRGNLIEANYQGLKKAYEVNSTLQHDYKNHMLAVFELVKGDKKEEVLNYINNYIRSYNKSFNEINSGNDIVNIIVSSKINEAKDKEIEFSTQIEYLGSLGIEDIDLCALLANLIDNAIEACEKKQQGIPWIELNIYKRNNMLFINLKNSIPAVSCKKKVFFKSEKSNLQLHGWGMKSINRVINKYDGNFEYNLEDNYILIFINIPF